ncbi:MAG: hypothetical protein A4E58_01947 [Syntrophorhabdus sp. PtaB.Bin006]|nr:MAG: hypothetical protein A4E58_01947 [Syntrophorhabdus sp. PtaB.Bin006]
MAPFFFNFNVEFQPVVMSDPPQKMVYYRKRQMMPKNEQIGSVQPC